MRVEFQREIMADLEADLAEKDDCGQRYVIDLQVERPSGHATVRSAWIVLADEDFPRFVSCYVT